MFTYAETGRLGLGPASIVAYVCEDSDNGAPYELNFSTTDYEGFAYATVGVGL